MLEQIVTDMERRLKALEARTTPVAKSTWRDAFGAMKDDELSREAARLGAAWRARENKRR